MLWYMLWHVSTVHTEGDTLTLIISLLRLGVLFFLHVSGVHEEALPPFFS